MLRKKNFFLMFLTAFILNACTNGSKKSPVELVELKDSWQFRLVGEDSANIGKDWMAAKIPGTVHIDLLENKKIEDPYYRDNEKKVQWIERRDWEYKTTFQVNETTLNNENIDLVFKGLDTYADVYLNDSLLFAADNMFIAHEADVKRFLKKGNNDLRIYFHSPVKVGLKKHKANGYLIPAANEYAPNDAKTSVFTRKAPFHYGWDWGPRLVTSGVWRPVYLRTWNTVRVEDIFIQQQKVSKEEAIYDAKVEVTANKDSKVKVELLLNNEKLTDVEAEVKKGSNEVSIPFTISNPKLWWSNGLGEPYLYKVSARLINGGETIDTISKRLGVRTIELMQPKDSIGKGFFVQLNGVPVFMKGSNYIPSDVLIPRVTEEKYRKVVQAAVDANMNMLRVWGGAIYENDVFYDICDEKGILVWHDFMFACNMMPSDSSHLENIRKEAEYNVKRLRNHPSMALWCGNNENMIAWYGWKWQKDYKYSDADSLEMLANYKKIFYDILPAAVKKYDAQKFYWPTSPGAGYTFDSLQNTKSGDIHDWAVWFGKQPFEYYNEAKGRFVSEYGMQAFPEMKTIKSFSIEEDWAVRSPLFEFKQRSLMPWISADMNGNGMINEYVKMYYKEPKDFEKFVYVGMVMQAEGLRKAIEYHRGGMPYCMGSLYWQINDCWPTVSWASMDYYFRWKASHYFVKKANREFLITAGKESDKVEVKVVSDKLQDQQADLLVRLVDFNGKELLKVEEPLKVTANSSNVYFTRSVKELLGKSKSNEVVMELKLMNNGTLLSDNVFYLEHPKDLKLPIANVEKKIVKTDLGYEIELSSKTLAKNVYLSSESSEGFFNDNYFDLLPGQAVKVLYTIDGNKAGDFEKDLKIISIRDTYK